MFNPLVENGTIAMSLNGLIESLNTMNDAYPRRVGTMVMVSDDTENEIEALVNEIDAAYGKLNDLSDEEIGSFTDDVYGYRKFLASVAECIDANRREIHEARQFLARYYSY